MTASVTHLLRCGEGVRMIRKQTHTHRNPPRIDCNIFSFSIYARTSNDMRNVGLDLGSATSTTTLIMMLHQNESASALSVYYFLIVSGSDYCTPSYQKLCIRKRFAFVFYPQRLFGLSFIYFRTISRFESCVANTMEMLRVSWLTGMRL